MPGIEAISWILADLILLTDPKCFSSARRFLGPMPGTMSSEDLIAFLDRFLR